MARLTPDTAFNLYLALGDHRSLQRVTESVQLNDRVSMKTMKAWSAQYEWVSKAKAHDTKVRTIAYIETTQADVLADRMTMYGIIERELLKRIQGVPIKIETMQDLERVANVG